MTTARSGGSAGAAATPAGATPEDDGATASGLANLRDAGALDGSASRLVRTGVLYRSDAPLPGDVRPAGVVWPPATVLDLRVPRERGDEPHPLTEAGSRVVSLSESITWSPARPSRRRPARPTILDG